MPPIPRACCRRWLRYAICSVRGVHPCRAHRGRLVGHVAGDAERNHADGVPSTTRSPARRFAALVPFDAAG
eukprot:5643597-Lingulodinium_polyedra.AAC.1